jgi:CBS domain-containing protein
MLVQDVMTPQVDVVAPGDALVVAARRMRDQDVACLPVMERGRLIGVVTARDLVVRGLAENVDASRATVRDAMSTVALSCFADQSVDEAHEVMVRNQVKRLPVLDRRRRLVGMVSLGDIVGHAPRGRPRQVTFYKRMTDSLGHGRDVSMATVYLSPAIRKEDAVPAAIRKFEADHNVKPWDRLADRYEVFAHAAEGTDVESQKPPAVSRRRETDKPRALRRA